MAKKEAEKKKDKKKLELEVELDKQILLLSTLDILKEFCLENILSLRPLLEESAEEIPAVEDRLIKFATMIDIMETLTELVESGMDKPCKKKCK